MACQPPIRVLIVDDHEVVRRGLSVFLSGYDDLELVGQAGDGVEALELSRQLRPDVVLMDLIMPDMDGSTATRLIRAELPDTRVVALTTFRDKELVHEMLTAGAAAFLYKDASVEELAEAIRQAHRGRSLVLAPAAAEALLTLITSPKPAPSTGADLTERERQVLTLLADGLTNRQIAHRLHFSESTAKQFVRSILAKLNVDSRTEAVALAMQQGILPGGPPDDRSDHYAPV